MERSIIVIIKLCIVIKLIKYWIVIELIKSCIVIELLKYDKLEISIQDKPKITNLF